MDKETEGFFFFGFYTSLNKTEEFLKRLFEESKSKKR